ncbi:NADPH-dependent F420 reductase [Pseudomaricurvus alkylphenolicus]|uniref:NADPH-dependent F420 reductase n=1 Tax=Pseudomaricurvus alkylphenolicus TaxID=1306991 RepID=UPI00141F9895|nr:NADPH-dependent F420 reductase [Pseudomaricurvus alkylphenolicus]NIB38410.1 NADPH-dependent F420 reductase [Pseudomaricurvus alkylphenolicus]
MNKSVISVLGGTGDLGGGLVYRWAKAGYKIIIGSRIEDRAIEAANAVRQRLPEAEVKGCDNLAAAAEGDVVVVSVPFSHQAALLAEVRAAVQGKIVIDTTVCLAPPKVGTVSIPEAGSAGMIAQDTLGENVKVVSAFQNIAAAHLNSDHKIQCDVLVCGNDKEARSLVIELARDAGMNAWHAGNINNSIAVEGMTSILITLNKAYKIPGAGIVVTTGK